MCPGLPGGGLTVPRFGRGVAVARPSSIGATARRGVVTTIRATPAPTASSGTPAISPCCRAFGGLDDPAPRQQLVRIVFERVVTQNGRLTEVVARKSTAPLFLRRRGVHHG